MGGCSVPPQDLVLLQSPPYQEMTTLQSPVQVGLAKVQTAYLPAALLNAGPCLCCAAKGPLCSLGSHQPRSPTCRQGAGEGRRQGGTCLSILTPNHTTMQVSAAPIRHPAEKSSIFCTAAPVYQLIKKLGCLPETDDKSLLSPTQGKHLGELRGLVLQ